MRRRDHIRVVISDDSDEEELEVKPRYCEHCLTFELKMPLRPLRIEYGKEPKPDHDLWLECYNCGSIYPKFQTKSEQALEGFTEPSDNPMIDNAVIEPVHLKRSSPRGKKAAAKRKKEQYRERSNDKEIDELYRKGYDVKVHVDTMPDAKTN